MAFKPKADAERKLGEYRKAFTDYGISTEGEVEMVAAAVRTSRLPVELSVALDDWAAALRLLGKNEASVRLRRVSLEADEDPWRKHLRSMLLAKERDLKALKRLAESARSREIPIPSLLLLARELARKDKETKKHERKLAIALLTGSYQSIKTGSADRWIRFDVSECQVQDISIWTRKAVCLRMWSEMCVRA